MDIELYKPEQHLKPMNIYDLYRTIQHKKQKRVRSYDAVLSKCYSHIQKAADSELFQTFFEVPVFLVGVPLFDLNQCTAYIITQLRNNGFLVKYFFPKILYISWEIKGGDKGVEREHDNAVDRNPDRNVDRNVDRNPDRNVDRNADRAEYDPLGEPYMVKHDSMKKETSKPVVRHPFSQYATKYKPNGRFVLHL